MGLVLINPQFLKLAFRCPTNIIRLYKIISHDYMKDRKYYNKRKSSVEIYAYNYNECSIIYYTARHYNYKSLRPYYIVINIVKTPPKHWAHVMHMWRISQCVTAESQTNWYSSCSCRYRRTKIQQTFLPHRADINW